MHIDIALLRCIALDNHLGRRAFHSLDVNSKENCLRCSIYDSTKQPTILFQNPRYEIQRLTIIFFQPTSQIHYRGKFYEQTACDGDTQLLAKLLSNHQAHE